MEMLLLSLLNIALISVLAQDWASKCLFTVLQYTTLEQKTEALVSLTSVLLMIKQLFSTNAVMIWRTQVQGHRARQTSPLL